MINIIREMRRRQIFRMAGAYAVTAWLVMQVVAVMAPALELPGWVDGFFAVFLILGFPIALLFAWIFEITPQGLQKTRAATGDESARPLVATDYALMGLVTIVIAIAAFQFSTRNAGTGAEAPGGSSASPQSEEIAAGSSQDVGSRAASVAVLPFIALSANEDDQYFADGLSEEVLNSLAGLPDLLVISRTSSFQFRPPNFPPLPQIAAQLGVTHLVEGSVRRSGDRVRITVQLVDARSDAPLWSQSYDRTMTDVFSVQAEIAEHITAILGVALNQEQLERMAGARTRNFDAFVAYQRGQHIVDNALGGIDGLFSAIGEAEPYFAEAVRLEPGFYAAYRGQIIAKSVQLLSIDADSVDDARRQFAAARRTYNELIDAASRAAPDDAARAMLNIDRVYFADDWSDATAALDATRNVETCQPAIWLLELAGIAGRSGEFIPHFRQATRCEPLNPLTWVQLSAAAMNAQDYDLALEAADRGLALLPSSRFLQIRKARILLHNGQVEEYREHFALAGAPTALVDLNLAIRDGDFEAAQFHLNALGVDRENLAFNEEYLIVLAQLGERADANTMVSGVDDWPGSFDALMAAAANCQCGAPWDLEATPVFAARLASADIPWPPPGSGRYPLKDW